MQLVQTRPVKFAHSNDDLRDPSLQPKENKVSRKHYPPKPAYFESINPTFKVITDTKLIERPHHHKESQTDGTPAKPSLYLEPECCVGRKRRKNIWRLHEEFIE